MHLCFHMISYQTKILCLELSYPFGSVLDEAEELPAVGGGVARVRAAPRRVRRLDQLGRQLPPQEPLRGNLFH